MIKKEKPRTALFVIMIKLCVGGLNEIGIGERPWGCPIEAELEEDDVLYLIEKGRIHKENEG